MQGSFEPYIELEGRKVGLAQPVFIIAEAGVNHNRDLDTAKKMIEAAAGCGVDAIKFQAFRTEEFQADRDEIHEYKVRGKIVKENIFAMFKRLELPLNWYKELFDYSREKNLVPLASVADAESVDAIERVGVSAFKLSSEDFINLPLIDYVARKGLPLILSTGMADEQEAADVLEILKKHNFNKAVFLHCVSAYPAPIEEISLRRMKALEEFIRAPVGYSDHALGDQAAIAAVALGACIIEKHFTLDKNMDGPDHSFSADPDEMANLVKGVRRVEKMLGRKELKPSNLELQLRKTFRRSIVAAEDLAKGMVLERDKLALKRPGRGLKARMLEKVIGKKLIRPIKKDQQIILSDLE